MRDRTGGCWKVLTPLLAESLLGATPVAARAAEAPNSRRSRELLRTMRRAGYW